MTRVEFEAGEKQKLVAYVADDTGGPIDADQLFKAFGDEAARLEPDGWRIVSATVLPMRQMGTAGNIFFQSGGQYATQAALAVVFGRQ